MSGILPAAIDYTDKDFDSLRARLISLIRSVFPTWTDFSVADFGTILLESFAHIGDVLCFNQDAAARESRITTAIQRRNILALVKLLAYKPKTASAATADVTIEAPNGLIANCPLLTGTVVKTRGTNPVRFQLLGELTLTPAALSGTVTVENSTTNFEQFTSTGLANQEFTLGQSGFLDKDLVVSTPLGTWTRVPNFLRSAAERHFEVMIDASERATIRFGNGICGQVPTGTISVSYKTGGGEAGLVDAGAIQEFENGAVDVVGTAVLLTVTNPERSVGGKERESVDEIRLNAPESIRSYSDRTVSRPDFETRALASAGVARALMLTRKEYPPVPVNQGLLYVVPTGDGFLTTPIRDAIAATFRQYPYWPSFILNVQDPWYLDVGVRAVVTLAKNVNLTVAQQRVAVRTAVVANLQAFFALNNADGTVNTNVDFGFNNQDVNGSPVGLVALSDIFNVVRDTAGVARIGDGLTDFQLSAYRVRTIGTTLVQELNHKDITIGLQEFPRLRVVAGAPDVVLVDASTGETF